MTSLVALQVLSNYALLTENIKSKVFFCVKKRSVYCHGVFLNRLVETRAVSGLV